MPHKKNFTNFRFILILIFIGVPLIGFSVYKINRGVKDRVENAVRMSFNRAAFLIKEKIDSYVNGLQGMNGVYIVSNFNPNPALVRNYAHSRNFFYNFAGALGFGFIRRVPSSQLEEYVKEKRKYFKNFNIKYIGKPRADESFIIEAIEPLEKNIPALGLDIASEEKRYDAAVNSMMTGAPILTAPIKLVQGYKYRIGFLFFLPIYTEPTVPKNPEERKSKLVGFSYAPIPMDSINNFLSHTMDARLVLEISDSNGEQIFADDRKVDHRFKTKDMWFKKTISIGGRKWILKGATIPNSDLDLLDFISWMVFFLVSTFYVVILRKIHIFVKSKEVVEEQNEELANWQQAILDSANFSIISTRPDGTITTFNKTAERMLGYKASEVVGIKTPTIFHDPFEINENVLKYKNDSKSSEVNFDAIIVRARESGLDVNEWTYITADGRRIPVRLSITVLKDAHDQIIGYLGIAEDMSVIKSLQKSMITSAKLSALGEMAGGVAHEINNPLAIISTRAAVMKIQLQGVNETIRAPLEESLSMIEATCMRMAKIVNGLRCFSRESSSDPMVDIEVGRVIQDTLDLCHQRIVSSSIKISVEGDMRIKVNCVPVQLSQVFMNLLSNAMDAIENCEEKWIKIEVKKNKEQIQVLITDSGNGIPEDTVMRMMEPFFTTKQVGKGTGLGLSISKGIVEAHKGSINYNLQNGHTQFTVSLPFSKSA